MCETTDVPEMISFNYKFCEIQIQSIPDENLTSNLRCILRYIDKVLYVACINFF